MSKYRTTTSTFYLHIYKLIVLLYLLQSCESKHSPETHNAEQRLYYPVNLFTESKKSSSNTTVLSFDDSYTKSKVVILSNSCKIVDEAKGRGVKQFYIYKVESGDVKKSEIRQNIKFPFLFLSREKLNMTLDHKDSVFLFLTPLKGFSLLRKEINIQYESLYFPPENSR